MILILKRNTIFVPHQSTSMNVMILLIVLAVLELCVTISCAVMGIKALKKSGKARNEGTFEHLENSPHHPFIVGD